MLYCVDLYLVDSKRYSIVFTSECLWNQDAPYNLLGLAITADQPASSHDIIIIVQLFFLVEWLDNANAWHFSQQNT